jgi:hypothetical protein
MNKIQKISFFLAATGLFLLAAACVSASPSEHTTPLYTVRMEQASSEMNFLPTAVNGFTYNTRKGFTVNHEGSACCSAQLLSTGSVDTCYGYSTCDGSYTCWQTCYGYTHGGATCLPSYCAWTCTPETCSPTYCSFTCVFIDTCMGTCSSTCPSTCQTCLGQGYTCDVTSCQSTCSTCDQPTCPDTCWDTCEGQTCWETCGPTCFETCQKPCVP